MKRHPTVATLAACFVAFIRPAGSACEAWCYHPCAELNGAVTRECDSCNAKEGYLCYEGADGYDTWEWRVLAKQGTSLAVAVDGHGQQGGGTTTSLSPPPPSPSPPPSPPHSLTCNKGVECSDFVPDERTWSANYVQQAYVSHTPQWNVFDSVPSNFSWASKRSTEDIRRSLQAIGQHAKLFAWGIKSMAGLAGLDIELYFYGYEWEVVREALDRAFGCDVRELRIPARPMMISASVPDAGMRLEEVDVYQQEGSEAFTHYANGTTVYKNKYWLTFVPEGDAARSEKVRQQFEWGNLSLHHLLFNEWEFGLCVARKSRNRTGVYFSGVAVGDARDLVPPVLREALKKAHDEVLVDVAYDIVDDKIVNIGVHSGYIVTSPPDRHIVAEGVNVRALSQFVTANEVEQLRRFSPNRAFPSNYSLTFARVGEISKLWNCVDSNESYARHGVIVQAHTDLSKFSWITERVRRLVGPVKMVEARSKTHMKQSNGVWLHTDVQRKESATPGGATTSTSSGATNSDSNANGRKRELHLLLYLTTLLDVDGGCLHVFTLESESKPDAEYIDECQWSGVRVQLGNEPIVTSKIGGEWVHGVKTFRPVLQAVPVAGSAILMDARDADNVHAVTQMHTATQREVFEVWFTFDTANITVAQYDGPARCSAEDTAELGDVILLHYVGTIDASSAAGTPGEQFASTREGGDPFPLTLGEELVKGLDGSLVGLCKGAKATIVIPPTSAGYADAVVGDPTTEATINFDVEIVDIQKKAPRPIDT